MNLQDTASPEAVDPAAAGGQEVAQPETQTEGQQQEGEKPEGEQPKKEKTPEEREIARLRRRVDSLTRRYYQATQGQQVVKTQDAPREQTAPAQADDEPVQLSRAELQKLVEEQARKLAPTISQQQAEIERRSKTVETLAQSWGQEKFDALATELDEAFGGLADSQGRPKPATDAIFESDSPRELIEYLADPDNASEAEALARMSPIQAGRAVARLETKLAAQKAEAQPKPSNAPRPIEPESRGRGNTNTAPDPSDTKAWMKWANEQERKR